MEKFALMVTTCTCLNLRKASRAVTQRFDEALQASGLRSTQLPVLVTLALIGTTTVTSLAEELLMNRTSLGRLLKPLVARGYIEILPGEDKRTRVLSLTGKGRHTVKNAVPMWEAAQSDTINLLSPTRWRYLHESLSAVAALAK